MVGILPHERLIPQPIEVDLTVALNAGEGVVDYARLYRAVAGVLDGGAIDFLEQVGDRVLDAVFAESARIQDARIAVRKPHVSLGGPLEYAEIALRRSVASDVREHESGD
jgi:dihydroneopterin aldolase